MQEPPGLFRRDSSPLSSLTPSPEPESRPTKRPRLSVSPQPQQPLFFAKHRSQSPIQQQEEVKQNEDLNALLEGLDEQEFDLPPSSDPVMRREDADTDDEGEGEDLEATVLSGRLREARREADDSGIGLIAEEEGIQSSKERPREPPDRVQRHDREDEYEGDDMWLGFDDQEMGFDQPDAFPSSIISAAPPSIEHCQLEASISHDKSRDGREERKEEEAKEEEQERKPADLGSFGFSNLNPSGGFVFATRKSFAPSAAALKRAQALFEDDEPSTSNLESTTTLENPFQSASNVTLPPRPTTTLPSLRADSTATSLPGGDLFTDSRLSLHPSLPSFGRTTVPTLPRTGFPLDHNTSSLLSFASSRLPLNDLLAEPTVLAPRPQHPPPANPLLFGFQNAAGRSIVLPSGDALDRARRRMDKSLSPEHSPASTPRPPSVLPSRAQSRNNGGGGDVDLFGTGSENRDPKAFTLAPIALLDQPSTKANSPFESPSALRTRSFIQTEENENENGRRSPLAPVENVVSLVPDEDATSEHGSTTTTVTSSSPRKLEQSPPPAPRNTDRPPLASPSLFNQIPPPNSTRPPSIRSNSAASAPPTSTSNPLATGRRPLPFRSPLISSARNASQPNSSTPLRPSHLSITSNAFPIASTSTATPLFNRRLNLGMTPRNKPFHLANTQSSAASSVKGKSKAFVTPFKDGKRPSGLTPMGLKEKTEAAIASAANEKPSPAGHPSEARSSKLKKVTHKEHKAQVFDLNPIDGQVRLDLPDFGMRPQTLYLEDLELRGIPEEILSMNSVSASSFVFPDGRSAVDAYRGLRTLVASRSPGEEELVTSPWVQNHWSLIIWKLASYVRSKPDMFEEWWKFEKVMDQMRYRYEREINQAQRSAIKRIQERDSAAALPLILCVSQLLWEDPPEDVDGIDAPQIIAGIELTDGWYRIRAKIDKTLQSACERGKLIVGSKLAIAGARLEGTKGDGVDVLEALGRSKLIISGNSTSLAPWHSTLGFCQTQFFASLDKLTCTGGSIAPLDIVIDKIFELGFVDAARVNAGTWGEEEELEKAEEWERGRKRIQNRMSNDVEKEGNEEDHLVVLLQEAVQTSCEDGGADSAQNLNSMDDDDDDPDAILERLEGANNKRSILRKLPPRVLQACLSLASDRALRSRTQAYDDLKQELNQKYPPRQIRSLRMMRVRDAREGVNGVSDREAILTVWDVKDYATDFFREGKRYQVTNTVAKGSWQRKHKQITLHTRKESKWTRVATL